MANVAERSETLQDHLLQQLGEWELEPALRKMCERIISALNAEDGGYLRIALRDLLPADAAPDQLELAEEAVSIIQSLDPPGVAARDLKECLLLQLNVEIPHYQDVRTLIQNHLEDLRDNRIPQIQKATGFSQSQLQEALAELRKLEPKPARRFVESYAPSVTPDLSVVQDENGRYVVKMDEGPSRNLYISKYYRQRLANGQATKEEREFIKRKVNAAQWLIESIEQRRATLMKVSQAIVDYQTKFLDNGPEFIEPLKMQQIADQVGVHVTTVSRAVDDKWIETPRGIFPLRRFFAGGTQTEGGEDIAWDRIRIELQKLIDHEDKSDPLSDDEIVKRMGAAGLKVARRTVTKYRQKMGIPSSRQRKDWSRQGN
jgi:RNA polymerase sigma-54 factor